MSPFLVLAFFTAACGLEEPRQGSCDPEVYANDIGLGLIQKSLMSLGKRNLARSTADADATRKADVQEAENVTFNAELPLLSTSGAAKKCYQSEASDDLLLPLPMGLLADLEAARAFGIVDARKPPCQTAEKLSLLSDVPSATDLADITHKNSVAKWLLLAWGTFAGIMVLWTFLGVFMVPKKQEGDSATTKLRLADEHSAFQRGFFYWLSLSWADGLVGRYGKCFTSVIDDQEIMWEHAGDDSAKLDKLKEEWCEEVKQKGVGNASLTDVLARVIGYRNLYILFWATFAEMFLSNFGIVYAMDMFLNCIERIAAVEIATPGQPQSLLEPVVMIVLLLYGIPMIFRLTIVASSLLDGRMSALITTGLASLVFDKSMNLPVGSKHSSEDEKPNLVQLFNVDIMDVFGGLPKVACSTIISPFMTILFMVYLGMKVGSVGFTGGLWLIPSLIIACVFLGWTFSTYQKFQVIHDSRMKWTTETLIHIRTIKALAWEKLSFSSLYKARMAEIQCSRKIVLLGGVVQSVARSVPWGMLMVTLSFMVLNKGSVLIHDIFILQRIIMGLLSAIVLFINGVQKCLKVPNSIRRLKLALAQSERPKHLSTSQGQPSASSSSQDPVIRIQGSFAFHQYVETSDAVLHDLDLEVSKGEVVGIVGAVAAGKSALLQTVLGDLYPCKEHIDSAKVHAPEGSSGRVAYCSQVPWIFEGTLRENVTLDKPFDQDRYYKALYSAAMTSDLQILPGGDQVTIGAFGVRLSGGQKARVALARAAYKDSADLVLLDDPFASVDVPTGEHLLTELVHGQLMEGRTRLVVMQPNANRLRNFDRVLILEGGRIVENGKPDKVCTSEAFKRLLCSAESQESQPDAAVASTNNTAAILKKAALEDANVLRDTEVQDQISWAAVWWWVKAASPWRVGIFLFLNVILRMGIVRENIFLATWADVKAVRPTQDWMYIMRCSALVFCVWTMLISCWYTQSIVNAKAAAAMFEDIMDKILRAPVDKFFDKQPIGRVINLLSNDMRQVDDGLVMAGILCIGLFLTVFMTQSWLLSVVPWQAALAAIPFLSALVYFIYLYRGIAIPLVFHSKFKLSNVQDMQAVVVDSAASIRANGMSKFFLSRYALHSATVVRTNFLTSCVCTCWITSRTFVMFSTLTCVFAISGLYTGMSMGTLSVVITLSMNQLMEWEGISMYFTGLLNVLNSLQRLMKFLNIPQEDDAAMPTDVQVRLRRKVDRNELVSLAIRRGVMQEAVKAAAKQVNGSLPKGTGSMSFCVTKGNIPVLRASEDGTALEFFEGFCVADLAPTSPSLQAVTGDYRIIAINSVSRNAEHMAEELCNPPSSLWLDLWHCKYAKGMSVKLDDLTAGYGTEKSVLHNINVDIAPKLKVGFVGKTGCGKSTTLLCILRVLEPRGGRIVIGGTDTKDMGLNMLRSVVGLVPQDPTVFEGTWRFNVDPFGEFPDGQIWEALQCVQLMPFLRTLPDGIDSEITRDGANLSFGHRQLLSLARMVVRQPPVLLLDECTSALDPMTQEAVQKTLLEDFPMSTVIAIAHRVETILNFDRIVVLNQGCVAEHGTVNEVLKIEGGIFANMVRGSGLKAVTSEP